MALWLIRSEIRISRRLRVVLQSAAPPAALLRANAREIQTNRTDTYGALAVIEPGFVWKMKTALSLELRRDLLAWWGRLISPTFKYEITVGYFTRSVVAWMGIEIVTGWNAIIFGFVFFYKLWREHWINRCRAFRIRWESINFQISILYEFDVW